MKDTFACHICKGPCGTFDYSMADRQVGDIRLRIELLKPFKDTDWSRPKACSKCRKLVGDTLKKALIKLLASMKEDTHA